MRGDCRLTGLALPSNTPWVCRASSAAACFGERASSSSKAASRASRCFSVSSSTMPLPAGARKSGSLRGGGEARPSLCLGGELPSLEGDDGRLNGEPGGALKASRMGTPTFITAPPLTMKSSRKTGEVGSEAAFDSKKRIRGLRNVNHRPECANVNASVNTLFRFVRCLLVFRVPNPVCCETIVAVKAETLKYVKPQKSRRPWSVESGN